MVREITTREQLQGVVDAGVGYVFNDFGGNDPRMNPVHAASCRWLRRMLEVAPGRLSVRKLWGSSLAELLDEIARRGKVHVLCGSEPDLVATGAGAPRARAGAEPVRRVPAKRRTRTVAARPTDARPLFHVERSGVHGAFQVWSTYRLQFDSQPATMALKNAIAEAAADLDPPKGGLLEAVYTSPLSDVVDCENVLLYNVGMGHFAAAARAGLRFERRFDEPGKPPRPLSDAALHHHAYAFAEPGAPFPRWEESARASTWEDVGIPRLNAFSKPDEVWLAMRHALRHAPSAPAVDGTFALRLGIEAPDAERVKAADAVKALVDGVVAAFHAHDGRDLEVLVARLAARTGRARAEIRSLLMSHPGALLGHRRLLWPRADGYQWNPGDDACVACEVRVVGGRASDGWRLSGSLLPVRRRSAQDRECPLP